MHRVTRWDGTLGEPRPEQEKLARAFYGEGVSLVNVERILLRRMQGRVRAAVRAFTRLATFNRQLAAYQAARSRGLRGADLAPFRPNWYAPDERGRYAWARRELEQELRKTWPRSRRGDGLQTVVLSMVQSAILGQLEAHNTRQIERGLRAKTHRLATQFVRVYFPTLCDTATPDRLRRRRGLKRSRSN